MGQMQGGGAAGRQREFESLDGMPETAAGGLHSLLWALADTKLLLGYHYGEWTFGTPALEAAVASCSLSQSELGHVRLLHALLKKHWGEDPEALVEQRAPEAFANIGFLDAPIPGWPGFVAMNAVVDLAATRVLAALEGSSFKPLRMSVGKMLDEERHHAHHGRGWFRTVGRLGGDDAERLRTAAGHALASVAVWLGPGDDSGGRALLEAGIVSQSALDVLTALAGDVRQLADEAGIPVPSPTPTVFKGWDPRTRRIKGSQGPAEDIVFHLRGGANALFKLGE
jgi:1,2-phenylacetyl-CoA epoxidase catalytic subunit